MSTKRSLLGIGLGALLAVAVGGVHAIPLTDLVANQGSITAGDKLFDSWAISANVYWSDNPGTPTEVDLSTLDVTGLAASGPDPLNPGPGLSFAFAPALSVTGDGLWAFADFTFSFRVHVTDPTLAIKDASLGGFSAGLSGQLGCAPTGDPAAPCNDLGVAVYEWVYSDAAMTNLIGGPMGVQFSYLDGSHPATDQLSDSTNFAPVGDIWVKKNVLVWSVNTTDEASLYAFSQRFSQEPRGIPEPSSMLLVGAALFGLLRRRRA